MLRSRPEKEAWAAERNRAGPDDRLNAASMINQSRLRSLGCFHSSRAISTSVQVERAFCMKKEEMDG